MAIDTSAAVTDRVIVITGAGQGIGRAYAHHFADNGAIPVIADIDGENGARVAAEVEAAGGRALAVQADVTSPGSVAAMVDTTLSAYGRLDVLINNAAIFVTLGRRPFEDIPLEEWRQVMDVNITGCFICASAVIPQMRKAGWGRIINISSSTVPQGIPYFLHYVTSKSALIGMSRAMAREVGSDGITVNTVLPGMIETEMENVGRTDEGRQHVIGAQSLKRQQTPEDMVGTLLFLASPASGFMTGQSLCVDGGAAFV
ncbi:MAG: glucose 1-dehydrogenase [Alphaproteobacteria bacterium]|nr:glucose 1-dehydrogenase [Alphaproteobacteria bacterium]MCZ6510405.1 glucose 1-dehydrogenase [Alphaproteobacteria bacterium]MCZ6590696.1 glucose 1-dehydrogenase [Alphaproteobacteria bacterium]